LIFDISYKQQKAMPAPTPARASLFALQGALPPRRILKLFFRSISGLFPIYFQKSRLYFTFFLK